MFKPTTFSELCNAMQTGVTVQLPYTGEIGEADNGHTAIGVITCIEREDGSGRCWNVGLRLRGNTLVIHCFMRC